MFYQNSTTKKPYQPRQKIELKMPQPEETLSPDSIKWKVAKPHDAWAGVPPPSHLQPSANNLDYMQDPWNLSKRSSTSPDNQMSVLRKFTQEKLLTEKR